MITFDEFAKLELKVGTVLEAEDVEVSEKLIKLKVDLGEEEPRQILAGGPVFLTIPKNVSAGTKIR